MSEDLVERMVRGDPSAYLPWASEPFAHAEVEALWSRALTHAPGRRAMLYVHVPYCVASCSFCMYFHRVTRDEAQHARVHRHLSAQIEQFVAAHGPLRVRSAYLGGGTPTAMPIAMLADLVTTLRARFRVDRGVTLTVEAHPGTTDPSSLHVLAKAGATRISMGLQSTEPEVLSAITRANPSLGEVGELVKAARHAGLDTNLDLVVGLPKQTRAHFDIDLGRVLALGPDSVTLYRFWPTHKARAGSLSLEGAADGHSARRWLRAGYVGVPARASAASTVLMRPRSVARSVLYAARGWRDGPSFYEAFGGQRCHLVGFGTGSISHAWGEAWLRDVTPLADVPTSPRYTGTRLTPVEEARRELRRALHARWPVNVRALSLACRVSERDLLDDTILERVGPWSFARPSHRARVLEQLMPEGPMESSRWTDEKLADVEPELVPLRRGRASATLLEALCVVLDIPERGGRFEGAEVVARTPHTVSLSFRGRGTALELSVEAPSERGAFVTTKRFALTYSVGRRALFEDERALLERVRARLEQADA